MHSIVLCFVSLLYYQFLVNSSYSFIYVIASVAIKVMIFYLFANMDSSGITGKAYQEVTIINHQWEVRS